MNGLHTLAPWWPPALVDLAVGGLCLALALARAAAPLSAGPLEPRR